MRLGQCLLVVALAAVLLAPPRAAAGQDPVRATLDSMESRGELGASQHDAYSREWSRARRAARKLKGISQWNFAGVMANATSLARRDLLAGRLAPVFLTIRRNYEWFWTERQGSAPYGARRTFDGSPVILQFYPGEGWQVQPLANFGRLNGLARSRHTGTGTLVAYADALLSLAVERKGFLAFEYYFPWAGGAPGWISGMTTATGMSAFARVSKRTGDPRYRDAAVQMLGAFFTRPPWGIRLWLGNGRAHYLQYSQSPDELIGNAFAQSLIGLDVFARLGGGSRAELALKRGLRQADVEIERYDTGAWSLYWHRPGSSRGAESDLHYHQLFEGFLAKLCKRFPDGPFCRTADRFARYETEPVTIGRLQARRRGKALRVRVWVSKRGSGTLSLTRRGRTIRRTQVALTRGTHTVAWLAPHRRRTYRLTFRALSLNGIASSAERRLKLR